jgi:subtilisin family serine protease
LGRSRAALAVTLAPLLMAGGLWAGADRATAMSTRQAGMQTGAGALRPLEGNQIANRNGSGRWGSATGRPWRIVRRPPGRGGTGAPSDLAASAPLAAPSDSRRAANAAAHRTIRPPIRRSSRSRRPADDKLLRLANHGSYLAVAAPGIDILVAAPNGRYDFTTGTSIATAHVSGLAALLIDRDPRLNPDAVQAILMRTAKDLGPKGRDNEYGAGLVDAYAALLAVAAPAAERTAAH